ncbi:MAG: hypothetical protein KDC18_04980 [Alphaproteobacteria bacterium]|nr:hypothetical protein [Alphaproteobacteria bacterium]MCB9930774.1 hypothetical protein [Alphaproteobacteria bacterium]
MARESQHVAARGLEMAGRLRGPNLIFWSMVVASLALSVGSFYTTWIGMLEFVGSDVIGVLIAFIITFGVQSLLYAISWGIAQNWRIGRGRLIGSVVMWLICAFISGFFSFYGFFNTQGGRDELTRRLHVNAEIQDELNGIADRMAARIETLHDRMIESRDYQDWMHNAIEAVITDSRNLEAVISRAARQESERLRRQIQDNTLKIADLRDREARSKATLTARDTDLANATANIRAWTADIDRLQQTNRDLANEIKALEAQRAQEAKTGEGPRWRQLGTDINSARAAILRTEAELAARQQQLERRQAELDNLEAVRTAAGPEEVISGLRLDIGKLEEENTTLQAKIARLEPRRSFDADRETASVEATRRKFENKDYSQYATLVDGCLQLENIIQANRASGARGIDCRSPFVAQSLDELKRMQAELAQYRGQCIDNQPAIADDKVDPLIEFANACLKFEPNGGARNDAYNAMASLKSRRGDQANPISTAKVALLEDHQANAVLALLLAIFVDLLVLICAIIGRHSGQSERVRAIDLLFDRSRKVDDDGIEYLASMPENPNQREIMRELVNMLVRENLADYHGHDGETIALRYGARERLLHERNREMGGVARPVLTPAPATSAPPPEPSNDPMPATPIRVPRGRMRGD